VLAEDIKWQVTQNTDLLSFSNLTARVSVLITLLGFEDRRYNSLPAGSFPQL